MKKAAFTICSNKYYYPVGCHIFVNTFKRFHPDIDLVVFTDDIIDKVFAEKKINFYMAKPTFAKLLTDKYDLVVNIDADTIILDRLTEVFEQDYEVGAVWNFNDYENASLEGISEEMYVQGGLVASRSKRFWDIWEKANKEAMGYLRQENDILNKIWYQDKEVKKMRRVIFDKEKNYLGCKSLNREKEFYIHEGKVMCRGQQVKAYHWAKGAHFPKLNWDVLDLQPMVRDYLNFLSYTLVSQKYVKAI